MRCLARGLFPWNDALRCWQAIQPEGLAENSRWQAPRRHRKMSKSGLSPQRGDRKRQAQRSRINSFAVPRTQTPEARRLRLSAFGPPTAPNVFPTQVGTQSLYKFALTMAATDGWPRFAVRTYQPLRDGRTIQTKTPWRRTFCQGVERIAGCCGMLRDVAG